MVRQICQGGAMSIPPLMALYLQKPSINIFLFSTNMGPSHTYLLANLFGYYYFQKHEKHNVKLYIFNFFLQHGKCIKKFKCGYLSSQKAI